MVKETSYELPEDIFINKKTVKRLRQLAVEELIAKRQERTPLTLKPQEETRLQVASQRRALASAKPTVGADSRLSVVVRAREQLSALADLNLDTVYLDYDYGFKDVEGVARLRSWGYRVGVATARILKPGETIQIERISKLGPDVILVRNLGVLSRLAKSSAELVGDFSLNITNSVAASWYLAKGLERISPSYDFDDEQLSSFATVIGGQHLEVPLYYYVPAFHMDYCLYARFLSSGTSAKDCGQPCARHTLSLRDKTGTLHAVTVDAHCRNTMYNGEVRSTLQLLPRLVKSGVHHFRLETQGESASQLRTICQNYQQALNRNKF